jgi:hypothetical membrane protein
MRSINSVGKVGNCRKLGMAKSILPRFSFLKRAFSDLGFGISAVDDIHNVSQSLHHFVKVRDNF